jgi:3-oxoacyl-[acyl-carrier-protein] synthase III
MAEHRDLVSQTEPITSFFERPGVQMEELPIGPGVPLGIERITNPSVGIGGACAAWGRSYDNATLPAFVESRLGAKLDDGQRLNLDELGFRFRHHLPNLSPQEHLELELTVGARLVREAAHANGWEPEEVDALLVGVSLPVTDDFVSRIAEKAGMGDDKLTVSVHKACDGSVASLNVALNPELPANRILGRNLARELLGKKVLVGGIEGLSRATSTARDWQALQLFANGAGLLGLIPGRTMKFLVGGTQEVYDEEGMLQVRMCYPHSRRRAEGESLIEVTQTGENSYRIAGLMHEPEPDAGAVVMAGPMGMVKLFVRNGVATVRNVYEAYRGLMGQMNLPGKELAVAIVHHANYKINQLKAKQLQKEGFNVPMPWLVSDFGNVSAASNMIAFLRKLRSLAPGDHVLFDGFGAGTYYDVVAVELSGA